VPFYFANSTNFKNKLFIKKLNNYLFDLILKTFVPHFEQVPVTAGLPFFIVTSCGSLISVFALHLTQYASNITPPYYLL